MQQLELKTTGGAGEEPIYTMFRWVPGSSSAQHPSLNKPPPWMIEVVMIRQVSLVKLVVLLLGIPGQAADDKPVRRLDGNSDPGRRSRSMLRTIAFRTGSNVLFAFAALTSNVPALGGEESDPVCGVLRLATCQFPVSADVQANGEWVRTQMRQASAEGANLIHFPECALSGYAGVDLPSIDRLDWDALHRETRDGPGAGP